MRAAPAPSLFNRHVLVLAVGLIAIGSATVAQQAPLLGVATHPTYGPYVTDPAGFALYLLRDRSGSRDNRGGRADEDRPGVCEDACLAVWPPYISAGAPAVGQVSIKA